MSVYASSRKEFSTYKIISIRVVGHSIPRTPTSALISTTMNTGIKVRVRRAREDIMEFGKVYLHV